MKPIRNWPIIRTILGKNKVGQRLNELLPLKKPRAIIGSIFRGISDVSIIPNEKDALLREKAEKIYDITKSVKLDSVQDSAVEALEKIHDLLDDGLLNNSRELSPEQKTSIRLNSSYAFFAWIVYEGLAVLIGWPSFVKFALLLTGGI